MTETPRDIANRAEALVITMPQRLLSLLLQAATGRDAQHCDPTDFVDIAEVFLRDDFVPGFEMAAGRSVAEPLAEANATLVGTISGIKTALPTAVADAEPLALGRIGRMAADELTPAVSGFLAALFDDVVAYEKDAAKRMKDVDSTALSEIDELARTINFIAINASVEAARAGDAGKGFAVIATQIRELSQKSKDAVDRIRTEFS